jgi:predicted component of type VI protein secretion system
MALFGFILTANANGQGTVEQSTFTLTEPLEVGATVLQPGDYQIKVVLLQGNRNMLQVSNADGTKLITTLLSIPHPEGPGAVQIPASRYIYYPAGAGHIKTLRTWFAANTPGLGGHDIVYTKQRALELAALVNEPVVATPVEVKEADYATAPLVVVTPQKEVKPYEVATAPKPPVPEAAPAQPAAAVEKPVHHKRLPKTASDVPLYAGLGFLSLLGALGLGALARRVV